MDNNTTTNPSYKLARIYSILDKCRELGFELSDLMHEVFPRGAKVVYKYETVEVVNVASYILTCRRGDGTVVNINLSRDEVTLKPKD